MKTSTKINFAKKPFSPSVSDLKSRVFVISFKSSVLNLGVENS